MTHFHQDGFFLVRLDDGSYLALSDVAPFRGDNPVEWVPDYRYTGTVVNGAFREPAYSSTFDREGMLFYGPAYRPMDRYVVSIIDGWLYVDTETRYCDSKYGDSTCKPGEIAPLVP